MGRKKEIEGQLNFMDMLMSGEIHMQETEQPENPKTKPAAGSFPECTSCWCATCEHSTVGGSVPRPFGEALRPCPSCELCISEGRADICVIGSADEGCSYRAEKEGL